MMVAATRLQRKRRGLLPKREQERPPAFLHAFRLYKSDLLFRSLVDLALVGAVVVCAKADFKGLHSALSGATAPLVALSGSPPAPPRTVLLPGKGMQGPGAQTIAAIPVPPRVQLDALQSSEPLATSLAQISRELDGGRVEQAWQLISVLDDRDALVAYTKAVVAVRMPGVGRSIEARRLLRRATEKAVYPAYLLMGEILLRLAQLDEAGRLPVSERVQLDDAGNAHPATRAALAAEAVVWWERAAAFGRPNGLRLLGMARARGLAGRVDLVGAAAIWRDAAQRGDAVSQSELAMMLLQGAGVQADVAEATRLFRLAADQLSMARIGLVTALTARSITGDKTAAKEAIDNLEHLTANATDRTQRAFAHYMLGQYLLQIAPAELRSPSRGLVELEKATRLGSTDGAFLAGEAYRGGLTGQKDPACAYGFYMRARTGDPDRIGRILEALAAEIGPDGVDRGKRIAFDLQPVSEGQGSQLGALLRASSPPMAQRTSEDSGSICARIVAGSPTKSFDDIRSAIEGSGR